MRGLLYTAMTTLLVVAFLTSFASGADGAEKLGYAGVFVYSVPLVLDVVALMATAIHRRVSADRTMRDLVAKFVLVPMVVSWGAQAVSHGTRRPPDPSWGFLGGTAWLFGVVVLAGVAPVGVAALLYLAQRFADYEAQATLEAAPGEVTATAVLSGGPGEGADAGARVEEGTRDAECSPGRNHRHLPRTSVVQLDRRARALAWAHAQTKLPTIKAIEHCLGDEKVPRRLATDIRSEVAATRVEVAS